MFNENLKKAINVLSMKYPIYEMFFLGNVLTMKHISGSMVSSTSQQHQKEIKIVPLNSSFNNSFI